jgi:hypothetical protein
VSRDGEGGICYNESELVFAIASRENIDTRFSKLGDCSKASVVNNYEDNSWAFVVITCLFA